MEKILKTIVIVVVAFLVLRFFTAHRKAAAVASPVAGAGASAATEVRASANGFVSLPAPFTGPADRLLVLAPPNCPSEEGRRADELVRQLNLDGFPCSRSGNASVASGREPTEAEMSRLNTIMLGPLPIVFINGRARNNPSISEIESEYGDRSR
jgi:hypothetical protein